MKLSKNFKNVIKSYNINNRHKGLICDNKNGNIITDSYSIIRLNNNNIKDKIKIEYIKNTYGINEKDKNVIVNYIENNNNNSYCNFVNINECEKEKSGWDNRIELVKINNRQFDLSKIRKIAKILGVNDITKLGIFTSENDNNFISITSKNGYAYLLGCRTF